jgi:ABC-type antimicrobial peptide transport system permease subunit
VIGISFRRGSSWTADLATAPQGSRPIVIDDVTARALFGDIDAVGSQVRLEKSGNSYLAPNQVFTVVGVVPFVFAHGPERPTRPSAYFPLNPGSRSHTSFFVRTSGRPADMAGAVEDALIPLLPRGQRPNVRVADDAFQLLTATRRFHATVMTLFALLAVLIGAAGIYGVIASIVAQRTREIGVRLALGATRGDIRRGVLAQAGRHLLLGLAIGLPIAWWLSRGFGTLFFQIQPTDVSVYAIVTVLIAAVGLIAAAVPARRASRVDPIVSLRSS